ncbi:MAG: HD domain-containing protein [bacterium]|nr:HD domain-containing protein [bacterium]
MAIARPVCHSRTGVHYVQTGLRLDRRTITRLTELGVYCLWIECGALPDVDNKINEKVASGQQELAGVLSDTVDQLRYRTDTAIDCSRFEAKVGSLLSMILDDPTHQPMLATAANDCDGMVRHLTNCAYMCLLIGTHLSGYVRTQRRKMPTHIAEDVQQLGLGAFVHDLGKTRISEEMRDVNILSPHCGNAAYRDHTCTGHEMFQGKISPLAAYMVLHHHQRYDGHGFPQIESRRAGLGARGLYGEKIHVFARILAVVDVFDHLLGGTEKPWPTIRALHALRQRQFAGWFDPVVVAALNRLMPPFMLGAMVTLTNGKSAVVVENHSEAPCHPSVRLLFGSLEDGSAEVSEEVVNLRTERRLNVRDIDGVDVRPYFYDPPKISDGEMAYWGLRHKTAGTAPPGATGSTEHGACVTGKVRR